MSFGIACGDGIDPHERKRSPAGKITGQHPTDGIGTGSHLAVVPGQPGDPDADGVPPSSIPVGTCVQSPTGVQYVRTTNGRWPWYQPGDDDFYSESQVLRPLTVVFQPEGTAAIDPIELAGSGPGPGGG